MDSETQEAPDNAIQLPTLQKALKRLWRVKITDSIERPQLQVAVLVRSETLFAAGTLARKTDEFRNFQKDHPQADLAEVTYAGVISA